MDTSGEKFGKGEKLCSRKIIEGLFENGNVFHTSMFKVVWGYSPVNLPFPAQVAFSVSKKGFRLAVNRNLIKRRMREAYRKNKHLLYNHLLSGEIQIIFMIIMKGEIIPDYPDVEKSTIDVFKKLKSLVAVKAKC